MPVANLDNDLRNLFKQYPEIEIFLLLIAISTIRNLASPLFVCFPVFQKKISESKEVE